MSNLMALLGLDDIPDWEGALCAQSDPNLWTGHTPEEDEAGHDGSSAHLGGGGRVSIAKKVCQGTPATRHRDAIPPCPLLQACADYALTRDIRTGVWGGMSEKDRQRRRAQAKSDAA